MIQFATQSLFIRTRVFLVIGIVLWFVVFPVYLNLSALDDLDQNSPYLSLKAIDQDDSASILDHEEKTLAPTFGIKEHLEVPCFIRSSLDFYPSVFDLCSKQLVLRC
jgi:hypothetical protein